jgi:O-antigen/teichoic acid export membrane protein
VQAVIAFATLPLATLRLDARHYGTFALVTSIVAVGAAFATLGSSYRLAESFSGSDSVDQQQVVSAQMLASTAVTVAACVVILIAWCVGRDHWVMFHSIPTTGLVWACASSLGTVWWGVASEVLTLTARPRLFAAVAMLQSLVGTTTLLMALFLLDWLDTALFLAAFMSSLLAGGGALLVLKEFLTFRVSAPVWRRVRDGTTFLSLAALGEAGYAALERSLLATWANMTNLGLYAHSQMYRTMVAVPVKAVARSVWSDSLSEARAMDTRFRRTGIVWSAAHAAIALCALVIGAFGFEIIGFITHGKFTAAAPWAAAGMAILLAQHLGKPQTAVVYASGLARPHSQVLIASTALGALCALVLIPRFGVWGAILAVLLQQICFRVAVTMLVRRKARTPFQDRCAVIGLGLIGLQQAVQGWLEPTLAGRVTLFMLLGLTLLTASRRELVEFIRLVRDRG